MIRSGDFNGDGLMDLLMNATGDSKWYFALNNGDGTFTKSQACILDIYDEDFTEKMIISSIAMFMISTLTVSQMW